MNSLTKLWLLIFLSLLCISTYSFSQTSWTWQNVTPQGNDLSAVRMLDSSKVFATTAYGTIILSTDAGTTWKIVVFPTHPRLIGLDVLSNGVCVAVGYAGIIIRSTDYGNTWTSVTSNTTKTLNAVRLGSKRGTTSTSGKGFAVGSTGTMLRTSDYGATWSTMTSGGTTDLYAVAYDSNTITIAGGSGVIRRSKDDGSTWKTQTTNTSAALFSISADASSGVVVGEYESTAGKSIILRMINSDTIWNSMSISTTNSLRAVSFWTLAKGIAVGDMGTIVTTGDSGKTWIASSINNEMMNISSVACARDLMAITVGAHGTMYITNTAGAGNAAWAALHHGRPITWYGLAFADRNNGVTAGVGGYVYQTTDGGNTWAERKTGATQLLDVTFCTAVKAFAVGWNGAIYNSTDGGITWNYQASGISNDLQAVRFKDSVGYVVGLSGVILRGASWGASWTPQTSPLGTSVNFYDAAVLSADTALIFGDQGYVLKTTNKGNTWTSTRVSDTTTTINSASFVNSTIGTIVGSKNKIYRTTNAGATWTVQPTALSASTTFVSVSFATPDTGMVTGYGVLLKTTNSGTTWLSYDAGTYNALEAVRMIDSKTAFLAGDYGTILKTTNGGGSPSTGVDQHFPEAIPAQFRLNQNYPNPFNPSTTVSFKLVKQAQVKLRIFDVLGREIALLLDEAMPAGEHMISWNAAKYTSGTYFCRLEVDGLAKIMKMLLIK